jgi:hypothetical protein
LWDIPKISSEVLVLWEMTRNSRLLYVVTLNTYHNHSLATTEERAPNGD